MKFRIIGKRYTFYIFYAVSTLLLLGGALFCLTQPSFGREDITHILAFGVVTSILENTAMLVLYLGIYGYRSCSMSELVMVVVVNVASWVISFARNTYTGNIEFAIESCRGLGTIFFVCAFVTLIIDFRSFCKFSANSRTATGSSPVCFTNFVARCNSSSLK